MEKSKLDAHIVAILGLQASMGTASHNLKRTLDDRIWDHRRLILDAYATARGWKQAAERFPVGALARVSSSDDVWGSEFTDHPAFWMINNRPAAVSAHLYGCDDKIREAACAWASNRGLRATFPDDFPSWWYPGRTTLIEIARTS